MIITKEQARDLRVLIDHVRRDIGYNIGGTFNNGNDEIDYVAIAAVERTITLLLKKIKYKVGDFEATIK